MEFNKKEMDITFEKFLKHSTIVINQRRMNSSNRVNSSYKKKIFQEIKSIFDLDPDISLENFTRNYIKRIHSPVVCKENVVKMVYLLIFETEINSAKDIEIQVNTIIDIVKKLEENELPLPKKYLIEKLKKMKKIKLVKPRKTDISNKLSSSIVEFQNSKELDTKSAVKLINLMIKFMKSSVEDKEKSEKLSLFCQALEDKVLNPENKKNSQKLYSFVENVILNLKKLRKETGLEEDYKTVSNCINTCKNIRDESMPEKEKFKQIEKNRKNKSHNKESLKHFFDIQKSTIAQANEIINQAGGMNPITESELPKFKNCEKFLKKASSSENLDEEIFNSYVEEMQNETKRVISERLKKSTFGAKAPSSQKILSEILNLF